MDDSVRESRRCNDEFGLQNVFAIHTRVLVQQGRANEACAIEPPDLSHAVRSVKGEVFASRGLALATLGRFAEARSFASKAADTTTALEARVLVPAIEAICAIRGRTSEWRNAVEKLVDVAFDAGGVDLVVAAYRGNADLLEALLTSHVTRERAMYIVARAGDEPLVEVAGLAATSAADPVSSLSPRELEVYELLCEGLSNGEIASRLFITEGTVRSTCSMCSTSSAFDRAQRSRSVQSVTGDFARVNLVLAKHSSRRSMHRTTPDDLRLRAFVSTRWSSRLTLDLGPHWGFA